MNYSQKKKWRHYRRTKLFCAFILSNVGTRNAQYKTFSEEISVQAVMGLSRVLIPSHKVSPTYLNHNTMNTDPRDRHTLTQSHVRVRLDEHDIHNICNGLLLQIQKTQKHRAAYPLIRLYYKLQTQAKLLPEPNPTIKVA